MTPAMNPSHNDRPLERAPRNRDSAGIIWRTDQNERKGERQGFAYRVICCEKPGCMCTEVSLAGALLNEADVVRGADGQALEWNDPSASAPLTAKDCFILTVDYAARTVRGTQGDKAELRELEQLFLSAFEDGFAEKLESFVTETRTKPNEVNAWQGYRLGELVPHVRIFPDRAWPLVHWEGQDWQIDDLHCIDPACECDSVLWMIEPVSQGDDEVTEFEPASFMSSTAEFEPARPSIEPGILSSAERVETLWRVFLGEHSDLSAEVPERRREMREAAPRHLRPPEPPVPVRRESFIGRNDPCTCGSGKKFKKCCGASAR